MTDWQFYWKTVRSFRHIHESISMQEIIKLYPILHEASEDKFVGTVTGIISHSNAISKLQQQRKRCGYSQRELAKKSGANLRTLQQYELKTKDKKHPSRRSWHLQLSSAAQSRIFWNTWKTTAKRNFQSYFI